ncbi:MAG: hypothetical protein ACPL7K_00425 [Armatimonadota bacterium]
MLAAEKGQRSGPEIRPGQTVVVIRPTSLKIEAKELAQLSGGTEAKVLRMQEDWLWCEIDAGQDSVQVVQRLGGPQGKPEARQESEEQRADNRHFKRGFGSSSSPSPRMCGISCVRRAADWP